MIWLLALAYLFIGVLICLVMERDEYLDGRDYLYVTGLWPLWLFITAVEKLSELNRRGL